MRQGRFGHTCGMVRQSKASDKVAIVVAGGSGRSVEFLDQDSNVWRNGTDLPTSINAAVMVEEDSGGVLLVGGSGLEGKLILKLENAGEGHEWIELTQMLKYDHNSHTAFLVPDDYANCTLVV